MTNERRKGFYFAASFDKGRKPAVMFLTIKEKPFQIDPVEGTVRAKCVRAMPHNFFADEWFFFEDYKISDIDKDKDDLQRAIEEQMEDWCKKYHRKYEPLFEKKIIKPKHDDKKQGR